jgi:hypothetical protein
MWIAAIVTMMAPPATDAATIAYWRFEDGTPGSHVVPRSVILDSSGNGNNLTTFDTNSAPRFTSLVPAATVPGTGAINQVALDNSETPGNGVHTRDLYTVPTGAGINVMTHTFTQWTVEASVNFATLASTLNGYQTFVGRDAVNVTNAHFDSRAAAFYLQKNLADQLQVVEVQADGELGKAFSPFAVQAGKWYDVAATSDGSTLKLFVNQHDGAGYQLTASTALIGPDRALANQNLHWTVGRGQFDDNGDGIVNDYEDWFRGTVDEVRISDVALAPSQFLFAVPEPSSYALLLLAATAPWIRRARRATRSSAVGMPGLLP